MVMGGATFHLSVGHNVLIKQTYSDSFPPMIIKYVNGFAQGVALSTF